MTGTSSVDRMINNGEIKAVKVGKSFRVPRSEIVRLVGETT